MISCARCLVDRANEGRMRGFLARCYVEVIAVARLTNVTTGGLGTAAVAQLVERVLGKDEVMGPSPISS